LKPSSLSRQHRRFAALQLLPPLFLLLLLLLAVPLVWASYTGTFDTLPPGTASPAPWTFSSNNVDCFSGEVSDTAPYLSPPNSYVITLAANGGACTQASGNYGEIVATFNASSTVVVATVWFRDTVAVPGTVGLTASITLQDSVAGTLSSNINAAAANTSWVKLTQAIEAVPGQTLTVEIGVQVGSPNGQTYGLAFDNITVKGANAVIPNADFYIYDLQTQRWFDINAYADSYITVLYTSGQTVNYNNLSYPDLNLPLTNARLVTVWVGDSYYDTFIPPASGPMNIWLGEPGTVYRYLFTVEDLTGKFPSGSEITVSSGTRVVASGYTDASDSFAAAIPPGTYTVTITNNVSTYSAQVSLTSTNLNPTIQIVNIQVPVNPGIATAITWTAGWNNPPSEVLIYYHDATNTTTSIYLEVYVLNQSGTYILQQGTFYGRYGTFVFSFPENPNLSAQMYAELQVTDEFGTTTLGPKPLTAPGKVFVQPFNVDPNLLGLEDIIPSPGDWQFVFAIGFLFLFAGLFGAIASPMGLIAVAVLAGFFSYAGWLPLPEGLATILITLAVTAYLVRKERQLPTY